MNILNCLIDYLIIIKSSNKFKFKLYRYFMTLFDAYFKMMINGNFLYHYLMIIMNYLMPYLWLLWLFDVMPAAMLLLHCRSVCKRQLQAWPLSSSSQDHGKRLPIFLRNSSSWLTQLTYSIGNIIAALVFTCGLQSQIGKSESLAAAVQVGKSKSLAIARRRPVSDDKCCRRSLSVMAGPPVGTEPVKVGDHMPVRVSLRG